MTRYQDLISGTPKLACYISLNEDYKVSKEQMVSQLFTRWNTFTHSLFRLYEKLENIELDIVEAEILPAGKEGK